MPTTPSTSGEQPANVILRDGFLEVRGAPTGLADKLRYFKKEIKLVKYKREVRTSFENLFSLDEEDPARLYTMPGFAHKVMDYFRKSGQPFEFFDARTPMPKPDMAKAFKGLRPYQIELAGKMLVSQGGILQAATGAGKALPNKSKVPTPDGFKEVGSIKEGDLLFGSNGKPTRVLAVHPQPEPKQVYEVEFSDGRVVECCADHLWSWIPRLHNKFAWKTTTTKDLMEALPVQRAKKKSPKVLLCNPVEYREAVLPVHPYVLGVFLGDGCMKEKQLILSSSNEWIPNKVAGILGGEARKCNSNNYSYHFLLKKPINRGKITVKNFLTKSVFTGCCTCLVGSSSYTKHIPADYLISSVKQRLELLRGLFDTDGSIDEKGRVKFTTVSRNLAENVIELARSLGMLARVTKDKRSYKYNGNDAYTVVVRASPNDKVGLFSLPYKVERAKRNITRGNRKEENKVIRVSRVTPTNRYEWMTCFTVEAKNGLFLCNDYVVTHNTAVSAALIRAYDRNELVSRGTPVCVFACPDRDINRKNWDEFKRWLPGRDIGLIMSGTAHKPSDDVVCCTIDSLENIDPNTVGILIVDEMHTSASTERAKKISAFTKAVRWGVSATPTGRFDGADIVAEGLYGPIVATFSYQDGVRSGALVPITVYWLEAPEPNCGLQAYSKYQQRETKIRHGWLACEDSCQMIADVLNCIPDDLQTLCMLQFIEQMGRIHAKCTKSGFVHAETDQSKLSRYPTLRAIKPKERKEIYDAFHDRKISSMISTHCWKQGVDFPELSVVVNAGGGGSDIVAKQVPGRASRAAEGKDHAYIVDFIHPWDRADPIGRTGRPGPLLGNDFARRKAYKDLGFTQCQVQSIAQLPFLDAELADRTPTMERFRHRGSLIL